MAKPKVGGRLPKKDIGNIRAKLTDGSVAEIEYDTKLGGYRVLQIIYDAPEGGGSSESEESTEAPEKTTAEKLAEAMEAQEKKEAAEKIAEVAKAAASSSSMDRALEDLRKKLGLGGGWGASPPEGPPTEDDKSKGYARMDDNVFKARLSSIMTDNKYDRRLKGRTRGKLDMTRLYKAQMNQNSVFTQKQARKGKEYNVVLVVDESGSMHGGKIETAAKVASFLASNFEGLNVNLAVIGFNAYITVHKKFSDPMKDFNNLERNILKACYGPGAGSNNDYEALRDAYRMFKGQTGKNVVVFMSDGQPASLHDQGHYPELAKINVHPDDPKAFQLLAHEYKDTAHTVGIGIMSNPWQVPNSFRVDSLSDVKPKIVAALRKEIVRG